MKIKAWKPYEQALWDYYTKSIKDPLVVHSNFVSTEIIPVSIFFRPPPKFPFLEKIALNICQGKVLVIGAGAGCHALILQDREFSVCAIGEGIALLGFQ